MLIHSNSDEPLGNRSKKNELFDGRTDVCYKTYDCDVAKVTLFMTSQFPVNIAVTYGS